MPLPSPTGAEVSMRFRVDGEAEERVITVPVGSTVGEVLKLVGEKLGRTVSAIVDGAAEIERDEAFSDFFEPWTIYTIKLAVVQIVPGSVAMEFSAVLSEWLGATEPLRLLWKSSNPLDVDGFHRACDGKANTLVIIQSKEGNIFGGFACPAWDRSRVWKDDWKRSTFLFVLKNTFGDPPTRFPKRGAHRGNGTIVTCCDDRAGPCFGSERGKEIWLWNGYGASYVNFCGGYEDRLGRGTAAFVSTGTGQQRLEVDSYEVWAAAGPPTPCA
jgi:hypothetical protein